jgi:hypothetical protein
VSPADDPAGAIRIEAPVEPLEPEVEAAVQRRLAACPDVAFAHLPQVLIPGRQDRAELVLFVWLTADAMRSLRQSLNLVSDEVARALPPGRYLDVVILNSAPELLGDVERAGCLLVERDPIERQRAIEALRVG